MNKDFLHYSLKFNDQLINKFEEVVIPRTDGQIPTHIRRQVPPDGRPTLSFRVDRRSCVGFD